MGKPLGEPVHGERIVDGNAATLTALKLYTSGSENERELEDTEYLAITDILIQLEDAADFSLVAGAAQASQYIVWGNLAANGGVERHYRYPYVCPLTDSPKFAGAAANRSSCIIEGYITKQGTAS